MQRNKGKKPYLSTSPSRLRDVSTQPFSYSKSFFRHSTSYNPFLGAGVLPSPCYEFEENSPRMVTPDLSSMGPEVHRYLSMGPCVPVAISYRKVYQEAEDEYHMLANSLTHDNKKDVIPYVRGDENCLPIIRSGKRMG